MKPPLSKRERDRKIKQIYREMEAKKRALGLRAPTLKKGPVFYMVVLIGMALLGGALIQMSGKADAIGLGGRKLRDGRPVMAQKSASVAPSVTITFSGARRTPRSASHAQIASRSQAKPLLGG